MPTEPVVAFLRQPDLDERGQHGDLLAGRRDHLLVHRQQGVLRVSALALGAEEALERGGRDARDREVLHRAADVAARVAVLQAPDEDRVDHRSRDDPELAEAGNGARQPPVGHRDAHPALNDGGKRARHGLDVDSGHRTP